MAGERDDEDRTPTQDDFVLAIESGPLAEVEIVEADDGSHVDLAVNAVAVDPDTGEPVPVSIALNADDSAYVVAIADEEFVVPLGETAEESSHRRSGLIGALRTLQQLAQRVEEETKGMAKRLAEKFERRGAR
ncbi:hypothetical protein [Leifsonia shinshuensis]|uniref:Uncharacterized protein n=1 Tax=Leifsonia shinshuensis TaxID=150026 RepID=A0A853CQM8_9MICO|nr:hypothetical protein [Leifsonia shinshuensis]NYJ22722.1 hypothetical protein [Leifsonia shinshuensis]